MSEPIRFIDPPCAGKTDMFYPPDFMPSSLRYELEEQAKAICADCPYISPCRALGIANEVFGVWGGMNGKELSAMRKQLGISISRTSSSVAKHRQCGTESGYQYVTELGIDCEDCREAHQRFVDKVLDLDPYQLPGNHGSCGTETGYQNLRLRALSNGAAANQRKVWCVACRQAHNTHNSRKIRERRARERGTLR